MNSAPAELLHPLTYAALQPNSRYVFAASAAIDRLNNASHPAGIGNLFLKEQTFFQRKNRLTRLNRIKRFQPEENLSVVYCSLIWIVAFHFFCKPGRHFSIPGCQMRLPYF